MPKRDWPAVAAAAASVLVYLLFLVACAALFQWIGEVL